MSVDVKLPGHLACMKELKRDHDDKLIGTSNENPILNMALYNVETPNGHIAEYTSNVIGLVPSQDGPFFFTRSHLSSLQNYALLFSTNFQFIFILKKCIEQFRHLIVLCTISFSKILYKYLLNSRTVL